MGNTKTRTHEAKVYTMPATDVFLRSLTKVMQPRLRMEFPVEPRFLRGYSVNARMHPQNTTVNARMRSMEEQTFCEWPAPCKPERWLRRILPLDASAYEGSPVTRPLLPAKSKRSPRGTT